jgi:hypothetical protein
VRLAVAPLLALALAVSARAQDSCEPESIREPRAVEAALARCEAVARVATSVPNRYAALCRGAAYALRLAEPEGERSSEFAERGVDLAARARTLQPNRVEGHYHYACCLGIYIRENKVSGFRKLDDVIAAANRAIECDERYDRGGPHRLLALLYSEAPRFVGPGDRDLARKHLARLLSVAGDDEENKLAAARIHREIGEDDEARAVLRTVDPNRVPEGPSRQELRTEKQKLQKELSDD